jgi:hypothetical protein
MSFLISTTGTTVNLYDLGVIITHPTIDRDLSVEFSATELADSTLLTTAINNGTLTLKISDEEYGNYEVDSTEYYSGLSVQNQFIKAEIENYITQKELSAGVLDTLIDPAASAISITSTASLTKNVYSVNGKFQKWKLEPNDKVVITGGAAAGTYTVDEVIDQYQFTVIESIVDTAGTGTFALYHPIGSTRVTVDTTGLTNISGSNLQTVLSSIDDAISATSGFDAIQHNSLRQLIHFINEGPGDGFASGCTKTVSGGIFPTSVIWRLPDNKKLVELTITRNNSLLPIIEEWKMYDTDGITVLTTLTDTINYYSVFENYRTRTIS